MVNNSEIIWYFLFSVNMIQTRGHQPQCRCNFCPTLTKLARPFIGAVQLYIKSFYPYFVLHYSTDSGTRNTQLVTWECLQVEQINVNCHKDSSQLNRNSHLKQTKLSEPTWSKPTYNSNSWHVAITLTWLDVSSFRCLDLTIIYTYVSLSHKISLYILDWKELQKINLSKSQISSTIFDK